MTGSFHVVNWPAQGRHYGRLLRSYALSRRLPGYWLFMVILLGMVMWGGDWGASHAPTSLWLLVFLLPVATASVIGVSLWSPFGETERSAGTLLPFGRAVHLVSMLAITTLINAVALQTWVRDAFDDRWGLYLSRHTMALVGIALLAARVVDSRLSWIAPTLVAMPGLVMGYIRMEVAEAEGRQVEFFHESWHLMLHPDDSIIAMVVAGVLFLGGMLVVIRQDERPAEPDEAAG